MKVHSIFFAEHWCARCSTVATRRRVASLLPPTRHGREFATGVDDVYRVLASVCAFLWYR
jgi:hypothetical protein